LRTFKIDRKLQEAVWIFIVSYMTTDSEKNEFREVFQNLDTKNDGFLSREELIEGFKRFMGENEAEQEAEKLLERLDNNRSGYLEYSEFLIGVLNVKQMLSRPKLESAFKVLDKDASGQISIEDFKAIFSTCSADLTDDDWRIMVEEFDLNKDGQMTFDDFQSMMLQICKNSV